MVLFHPGNFPELNQAIGDLYKSEGFGRVMVPTLDNSYLNVSEYEYHRRYLVDYGIPEEKISLILGEQRTVSDVIRNAMLSLEPDDDTILLAGKAFFCRRFLLLASRHAGENKTLDIYPLIDDQGINKATWHQSQKGRERVLNEVRQYGLIVEE